MQQLVDFWRMVWRRSWIIATVLLVGLPLVGLYAYLKLPLYESEATILVESQRIPNDLARPTVTAGAGERLQGFRQRLMARSNVVRLIQDLGLYADRDDLTLFEKVELVRKATEIVPITLTGRRSRRGTVLSAFIIRVTHEDPTKAAALVNEFVTQVLDLNIRARSERASETLKFFKAEQARLGAEIQAKEQEIKAFKEKNKDALPESLAFRQNELSRIGDKQGTIEERLLKLEEERRGILLKLEALKRTGSVAGGPSPEETELARLEAALIQQEAVLSPDHPSIRVLKNRIEALKKAVAESAKPPETTDGERPPSAEEVLLRSRLDILVNQVKLLVKDKADLERRQKALADSLERTPAIEIELNRLNRELTEKQEVQTVVTRKRAEAETGEKLEVNQQAERFEVIENAIVPQKPIAPDRRKIVIMGSGLMIVFAFGFAFAIDQMRPRLRSAEQIERQLGLRTVVTVPYVRTRSERRRRLTWRGSIAALVLLGIPLGLYAVDRFYKPLPLVVEKLAEKSGASNLLRMIEKRF